MMRNCGILNRFLADIVVGHVRSYSRKLDETAIQRQVRLMGKFDEEIRKTMEKIQKNQKNIRVKRKKAALSATTKILLDKNNDISVDMSPNGSIAGGMSGSPDEFGIRHLSNRMKIYNSTYLRAVADIFATDEQFSQCLDRGLRLTNVRVSPDCRLLQIYWMMDQDHDESRDSMAAYLYASKGRIHELLVEMQTVRNVPWIVFVYDLRASNEQEVEKRLEKCRQDLELGETNKNQSDDKQEFKLEDRINFSGEMNISDGQEEDLFLKLAPTVIPEDMPTNLFNLDYDFLWNKVLTNMHRTRPQHRQDLANQNSLDYGIFNTASREKDEEKEKNPLEMNYDTENRIKAIKKFVISNRKRKDKLERKLKRKILSQEMERFDDYEQLRESLEQQYSQTFEDLEQEHQSK